MPMREIRFRIMSFAPTPFLQCSFHAHFVGNRRTLQQALARQNVLHLAGADAERQRAESAMRGCVAVAANDRHPRLRQALLRPDDVDDPLFLAMRAVVRNTEIAAILLELRDLRFGDLIDDRKERSCVGMLWSVVPIVRSGRRTFNPRSRNPEKACGEVTSCTRCRSI